MAMHKVDAANQADACDNQGQYFGGYACLFNQLDLGNDIILPAAFNGSFSLDKLSQVRMLWQHDPSQPIGRWEEIKVDKKGLYVVGRLSLNNHQSHDIATMLNDKIVDGLSIGFKTRRAIQKRQESVRYIQDLELWEISIVTFPMQPNARITEPNLAPQSSSVASNTVKRMQTLSEQLRM